MRSQKTRTPEERYDLFNQKLLSDKFLKGCQDAKLLWFADPEAYGLRNLQDFERIRQWWPQRDKTGSPSFGFGLKKYTYNEKKKLQAENVVYIPERQAGMTSDTETLADRNRPHDWLDDF
jgi:hypothetical protein